MANQQTTRMTCQRRVILEELRKVTSHPTAEEIYAMVRQRLPRVSLGTVYRNLEILSEGGEVLKLETAGRRKRFDGKPQSHYHIRCVACGRVDDVPVKFSGQLEKKLRKLSDYQVTGHSLEFQGICPACGKRGNADCAELPLARQRRLRR